MFVVTKHRHQQNRRIHHNKELPSTVDVNIEKYTYKGTNENEMTEKKKNRRIIVLIITIIKQC